MTIREIKHRKRDYLPLLLLADEQESKIDQYLGRSVLYALEEDGAAIGVCAVTDEGGGVIEIQNLAITPARQRQGPGRRMIEHVASLCRGQYAVLQVGTGESPLTIPFYERCGFTRHHVLKNFFPDHYDHPIYECGKRLTDKVYLRKTL